MSSVDVDIAVAPHTPVYFGDGRPNDAGETDYGASRFPPSPRTMQGLVRTALLRSVAGLTLGPGADRERIKALVGSPEQLPAGWQVTGPWPAAWRETEEGGVDSVAPWLPCPAWLEMGSDGKPAFRSFQALGKTRTDLEAESSLIEGVLVGTGRALRAWLDPADTLRVLLGKPPQQPAAGLPPFVRKEPHTGLQIDPERRKAVEGMLYTLDYYRFRQRSGMVLRFHGVLDSAMNAQALCSGVSNLGRRNRVAQLLRVSAWDDTFRQILDGWHLPGDVKEGDRFFIWTTTPVWLSNPLDPGLDRLQNGEARLELVSAALGYPESIGGFSFVQGHGTPARRYLPGGSSWLVRITGGNADARRNLLNQVHNSCCLGDDPVDGTFGFGHALVARVPNSWR